MFKQLFLVASALLALATPLHALPIEATVGSGPDSAFAVVHFADDAAFLFEVLFSGSTTGIDMIETIAAELAAFSAVVIDFGPGLGKAVDGLSYLGHSNVGFVPPDGYWSYWIKDAAPDSWSLSPVGASSRLVLPGNWDGWRYPEGVPVPEPGTGLLVSLGIVAIAARQRSPRRFSAQSS